MPDEIPHDQQITPAHVLEALSEFKAEVKSQFDALKGDVAELKETAREAGLNGHTPYLKAFLEQYAATYQSRQAWITVWGDITHRLRFLVQPRNWLRTIFYASLGAVGWDLVSNVAQHPPHIPTP